MSWKQVSVDDNFWIYPNELNVLGDPIDFLSWFLNALHIALNGSKKRDSSIVYRSFLGSMRIYTRKIPPIELEEEQKEALLLMDEYQEKVAESPFLYLTCDLPPPPLFKDEFRENIIPQVWIAVTVFWSSNPLVPELTESMISARTQFK